MDAVVWEASGSSWRGSAWGAPIVTRLRAAVLAAAEDQASVLGICLGAVGDAPPPRSPSG